MHSTDDTESHERAAVAVDPAARPGGPVVLPSATLTIECPDERGLVFRITGILAGRGANIVSNDEFVDRETGRFFMRTEFVGAEGHREIAAELERVLPPPATVYVREPGSQRLVVLASKEHHCLGELLMHHEFGGLEGTIVAVISNHERLRSLVERFTLPFHYIPHDGRARDTHEAEIESIVTGYHPDLLVLAKYMRILSPEFVARYPRQIINIHHSFLPAFIGANPYRQAFERGVKMIGATAHFVTNELDEGPIIAQSIIPVDHTHGSQSMAQAGRDVEKLVLAQAVRLVMENRVFVNERRTVVFA
jgi:formyltetrahydrofolate deformylase